MSTDPREFEHPIDECNHSTPNELPTVLGVGSIPAEAIEAVIDAALDLYHWEAFQSQAGDIAEAVEDVIRKAVTNAAPLAAAEALRDAADEYPADSPEFAYMRADGLIDYISVEGWLRARAATIESEAP